VLPLGRALAGPAADAFGIRQVLGAATVCAVIGTACMLSVPAIRALRRKEPATGDGAEDDMQEGPQDGSQDGRQDSAQPVTTTVEAEA
jgi:predicted lipid-binding transport protein (Tim44 family)